MYAPRREPPQDDRQGLQPISAVRGRSSNFTAGGRCRVAGQQGPGSGSSAEVGAFQHASAAVNTVGIYMFINAKQQKPAEERKARVALRCLLQDASILRMDRLG